MSSELIEAPPTVQTRVCRLDDLTPGIGRTFTFGRSRIVLFRMREGTIYATDANCPHAGAPLADGIVSGQCIVCPYHARRFDLASGRCDDGQTAAVATYAVSVDGEWVSVHITP